MVIRQPVGVIIFGILYFLFGVMHIVVTPLFSILCIITGIELFLLEPFARYFAIVTSIIAIIFNILGAVHLAPVIARSLLIVNRLPLIFVLPSIYLFHGAAIYFFTRPKVKAQFGSP